MTYSADLLFLLHDVARLLRAEADRRAGMHGMTRAQWVTLFWLDRRPGLSQKELAEILEVEPITVARLIDRLQARGMVERRPDPKDRRIWRLHLLPPARLVLEEMSIERADMKRMITDDLDAGTERAMTDGLQHMKTVLLTKCRHKGLLKDPVKAASLKDVA